MTRITHKQIIIIVHGRAGGQDSVKNFTLFPKDQDLFISILELQTPHLELWISPLIFKFFNLQTYISYDSGI